MTDIRNPDGSYMNHYQIGYDLWGRMTESECDMVRSGFVENSLLGQSQSDRAKRLEFMMWLRNSYGMWKRDNPYVVIYEPRSPTTMARNHPRFPENLSETIIETVRRGLHIESNRAENGVSSQPFTMSCRLDDNQVAELRKYVDDAVASLRPNLEIRPSTQILNSVTKPAVKTREAPPTYVRMGVTDPTICYAVDVFLDGKRIGDAIGADSRLGYVLTVRFDDRKGGVAFGRRDGDVEIRWAQ